jgi:ABC-type bacteriocin/lantibiotic exporter with double-glycine peptidase domain
MRVIRFIFAHLDQYRTRFFAVAVASVFYGVTAFLIPVVLARFADGEISLDTAKTTMLWVIGLYVVNLVFAYVVRNHGEALAGRYANHIRLKYFRQLAYAPLQRLRLKHSGYMQSLVNKISDSLVEVTFSIFWHLAPGVFVALLFLGYIAQQSVVLAAVNLVLMVVFVVVSVFSARRMVPLIAEKNRGRASLLGGYADFMANISTISQLAVQPFANKTLGSRGRTNDAQIDALQQFHARRWFALHSLFGVAYMATICYLIWQIQNGTAGVGLLILFVAAYGTVRNLIESFSENIKLFMEIGAYIGELDGVVDLSASSQNVSQTSKPWARIQLKDIAFKYAGSSNTIHIPEFTVRAGEKVCVEGKSGQGKSTLLAMVTNSMNLENGERSIDAKPYATLPPAYISSQSAMITQEAELFHLSVRDNLCLGTAVEDTVLVGLLEELELKEWFDGLEAGLDSVVGEKGVTLSAGQRQRLNILRGVLLDRSLYVLDEPTSHLDDHTERVVVAFLQKYLKDKAVVVVTHRPAIRALCSRFYEMKGYTLHEAGGK